ncbi:hypothetical protein CCR75_008304 [Bremia lactucae]|uniref:Uncharacterized protein n=1 Tax=Bremia lactucae TaxID=4779 RepID=A0A976IJH5_BRELC|nr:hypothetical protein CCR75_008304 [Bremia lactucae]
MKGNDKMMSSTSAGFSYLRRRNNKVLSGPHALVEKNDLLAIDHSENCQLNLTYQAQGELLNEV